MTRTVAAVGHSENRDPQRAGREAVARALDALGGGVPSFCLFFATVGHDQGLLLSAAKEVLGSAPLIGCSGEGVIAGEILDEGNFAAAALVVSSETLRLRTGAMERVDSAEDLGRAVRADVGKTGGKARAVLLFSDGLRTRFDRLAHGLNADGAREDFVPVLGGLAGENWSMTETYQYRDGTVFSGGAVWGILEGEAELRRGISHGCRPVGSRMVVTRAEDNALYELDGRPVLDVLREYLTPEQIADWDRAVTNLAFGYEPPPDLRHVDPAYGHVIVHLIPTPEDAALGRVLLPSRLEVGTELWLVRRDPERIRTSLDELADRLVEHPMARPPAFALQVDCASRGRAVFPEALLKEGHDRLRARFPTDLPWIGFYSYGEFCPIGSSQRGHCYTAVLAIVS